MRAIPIPELTVEDEERFWGKIKITANPTKCWDWAAGKFKTGYGAFQLKGKTCKAHRVAYYLIHVFDESDKPFICHKCDNPACCNPSHLFLGTPKDNTQDKLSKDRGNLPIGDQHWSRINPSKVRRGEGHNQSVLTEKEVREIRARYAAGAVQRQMAAEFGISTGTMKNIVHRKIWKHVV